MATSREEMRPAPDGPAPAAPLRGPVAIGLVLIFVGAVVLLDRNGIGRPYLPERLWPFVLIIAGVVRMSAPAPHQCRRFSRRPGTGFLIVGCWGAVNESHAFGLDYDTSWPLLVVAAGLMIVWQALEAMPRAHPGE